MRPVFAFDGGGVRGAISVAFLERNAHLMGCSEADPIARRIDLAGGTSTGAIIAGKVALGHSAMSIRDFYLKLAPCIFVKSMFRIPGLQSVFGGGHLKREIIGICGDRTLASDDLMTVLIGTSANFSFKNSRHP